MSKPLRYREHPLSVSEYFAMFESGALIELDRVELIEGLFRGDEEVDALLIPELGTIPASRILRG